MRFQDIPGLELVKKQLSRAVQDQHASPTHNCSKVPSEEPKQLWPWPLFRICFARNERENDACGTCPSCQKVHKGIHPDLLFVFPSITTKKVKEAESDAFLPEWRKFHWNLLPNAA
jgi:DNA polymerase-3 subunit delta'